MPKLVVFVHFIVGMLIIMLEVQYRMEGILDWWTIRFITCGAVTAMYVALYRILFVDKKSGNALMMKEP